MAKVTVDGRSQEWGDDKRLVLAIEEMGVNIGHRCGGNARCTTCRVEFVSGEPDTMTEAEFNKLRDKGLYGQARLSCQIVCSQDMEVRPLITLETEPDWTDTGPHPDDEVQPQAEWIPIEELEERAGATL